MLTALSGQINASLLEQGIDAVKDRPGYLRRRVGTDFVAADLAGGASHHQDIPRLQPGDFQKLCGGLGGLSLNLLIHMSNASFL